MNIGRTARGAEEPAHDIPDNAGQEEHLFAHSTRASRSTLPPIDTGRTTPLRLRHSEDDINSPATPDSVDMEPFRDVATLPRPIMRGNTAHFGSVQVPLDQAREYHAVRIHAVRAAETSVTNGNKGQKYVAYLEGRGEPTEVHPYPPGTRTITTLTGGHQLPAVQETIVHPDLDRVVVRYSTRRGLFTQSGEKQSAATGGVHELGHAARMYRDPNRAERNNIDPNRMFNPPGDVLPGWTDSEERHIITKLENPVARAHGEGMRDTHGAVAYFLTDSITSAQPADPRAAAIVSKTAPALREYTQQMDRNGKTSADTADPHVAARSELSKTARQHFEAL